MIQLFVIKIMDKNRYIIYTNSRKILKNDIVNRIDFFFHDAEVNRFKRLLTITHFVVCYVSFSRIGNLLQTISSYSKVVRKKKFNNSGRLRVKNSRKWVINKSFRNDNIKGEERSDGIWNFPHF